MLRKVLLVCGIGIFPSVSQAAYTLKEGKFIPSDKVATLSSHEHYQLAKDAWEEKNWQELLLQSRIILVNFPDTPFALDAHFYAGIAYFHEGELDMASSYLRSYLKKQLAPRFFEEALSCQFLIAEEFAKGARRRILGKESLPKWMPAYQEALVLYEEIITALPQHELTVCSLYGKGNVLFREGNFKESLETFETLLRRFPRHALAKEAYVAIMKVYKTQSEKESPDPDYLDLAEINYKKFCLEFPGDPKLPEAGVFLSQMQEVYAQALYETARFYERTGKSRAAMIYFTKIAEKYPTTAIAALSLDKLHQLNPSLSPMGGEKVLVEKDPPSSSLEIVR